MIYLAAFTGVDPIVFSTGAITADDAHVLCIGERVGGRVLGGGRGRAPREPHEGGGGGAGGLQHPPRPAHCGQEACLGLDVQGALGASKCLGVKKIWIHHRHYTRRLVIKQTNPGFNMSEIAQVLFVYCFTRLRNCLKL